jgi:hypothetical protein
MAQTRNIDTARRNIGCNQGTQLAAAEIAKHLLAQGLAHITMKRINSKAANLHEFCQCIGTPFGADKDQALAGILFIQNITKPVAFIAFGHQGYTLGDLVGSDAGLRCFYLCRIS